MDLPSEEDVQITADGLVHLRSTSALARRLGIDPRYDRLFQTKAGAELASTALALDPVYEQFNLVRYAWFARQLAAAAARFSQMVILGAGYDTRSLALPAVQQGTCHSYDVDYASVLSAKRRVLLEHGVSLPDALRFVACDLNVENPRVPLLAAGFAPSLPSAVLMEGLFFFLQGERASAMLDPSRLGLAPGSLLVFDAWTPLRASRLNQELRAHGGRALFGEAALGDDAAAVRAELARKGYSQLEVVALDDVCDEYGVAEIADPMPRSWLLIRAQVS